MWIQNYDPQGDWRLSTAVAAVPVLLLLLLLALGRSQCVEGGAGGARGGVLDRVAYLLDAGGDGFLERVRRSGLCALPDCLADRCGRLPV